MRQVAREQEPAREVPAAQSAMLALLVEQLRQLIPKSGGGFSEAEAARRIPSGLWTRKEALGHLIDWGTAHHQWLARALSEPKLIALAYPSPEWVAVMQDGTCSWLDLGELWRSMNTYLVHVFAKYSRRQARYALRDWERSADLTRGSDHPLRGALRGNDDANPDPQVSVFTLDSRSPSHTARAH